MEQSITNQLSRIDTDRMRRYRENLDFYRGSQWTGRARSGEKRLTFNYAKVSIDKITSYLISSLNYAVDPLETSQESIVNPSAEGRESGGIEGLQAGGSRSVRLKTQNSRLMPNQERAKRAEEAIYQVHHENNLEQLDFDTELGFLYPLVEQTARVKGKEAVDIAEALSNRGILRKSYFDRLLHCPRCQSINLRPSTHCPKCGSSRCRSARPGGGRPSAGPGPRTFRKRRWIQYTPLPPLFRNRVFSSLN